MKRIGKRIAVAVLIVVAVLAAAVGVYAGVLSSQFNASISQVYNIPLRTVVRSSDPAVIARGKHVAESIAGCAIHDCHGADLGGGKVTEMGPLGTFACPNVSSGGLGAAYSDAELARLIHHGIKKDGRSLRFMPAQDICWLPDSDVTALISYIRSLPAVDRPNGPLEFRTLAKVLDRRGQIAVDVARRIDHEHPLQAPAAAPTADYGKFLGRLCTGCHGDHLSGGPIPGAPPSIPTPLNLTPHETGLKGWTYEDFDRLLTKGVRKNGQQLNPFMPFEAFGKMDDTEKHALFAYLQSLPPLPLGSR